jgi:hypothetical protein
MGRCGLQEDLPAYFDTHDWFTEIAVTEMVFKTCFLLGRHGMHRCNHQDHSMLTRRHGRG